MTPNQSFVIGFRVAAVILVANSAHGLLMWIAHHAFQYSQNDFPVTLLMGSILPGLLSGLPILVFANQIDRRINRRLNWEADDVVYLLLSAFSIGLIMTAIDQAASAWIYASQTATDLTIGQLIRAASWALIAVVILVFRNRCSHPTSDLT